MLENVNYMPGQVLTVMWKTTHVRKCPTCQKFMRLLVAEPIIPHKFPDRLWEVLGVDLFVCQGSNYLVIVDYYSTFSIVRKITRSCDSLAVVKIMK